MGGLVAKLFKPFLVMVYYGEVEDDIPRTNPDSMHTHTPKGFAMSLVKVGKIIFFKRLFKN